MARVAEYEGSLYEIASFAQDFLSGQDMVVLRRYWERMEDLLNQGCTYGAVSSWVVTIEYFKENFRWVDA